MKTISITLLVCAMSMNMVFSQNSTQTDPGSAQTNSEEIKYRHSLGASLFMLSNFMEESADYYLLTYGITVNP